MDAAFYEQWKIVNEGEIRKKVRRYRELNQMAAKGQTVCAGSSLMELFPINEMLMNRGSSKMVYNRGIGGFTIDEYDEVLDVCVLDLKPSKLFINIGSNDLNLPGDTIGNLIAKYRKLLLRVKEALPDCQITLIAYYPCRKLRPNDLTLPGKIARTMENVNLANERVQQLAEELGCAFLNLNKPLLNEEGHMREEFAVDQIHLSPAGYAEILPLLEPLL